MYHIFTTELEHLLLRFASIDRGGDDHMSNQSLDDNKYSMHHIHILKSIDEACI